MRSGGVLGGGASFPHHNEQKWGWLKVYEVMRAHPNGRWLKHSAHLRPQ